MWRHLCIYYITKGRITSRVRVPLYFIISSFFVFLKRIVYWPTRPATYKLITNLWFISIEQHKFAFILQFILRLYYVDTHLFVRIVFQADIKMWIINAKRMIALSQTCTCADLRSPNHPYNISKVCIHAPIIRIVVPFHKIFPSFLHLKVLMPVHPSTTWCQNW